jgi:hypothetical protein
MPSARREENIKAPTNTVSRGGEVRQREPSSDGSITLRGSRDPYGDLKLVPDSYVE